MSNEQSEKLEFTRSSGNVFADLGLPDSENYLAKAELSIQINHIIEKRGLKQKEAAKVLGIDQPKVSALRCSRLDDFSIERLISFLNKLDRDVEIVIKRKPTRRKEHGHLRVAFA